MSKLLQTLIIGTVTGSLYSLLAMGMVLVYRTTGVLNIAHGEFVMLGAFIAFLVQKAGIPYLAAVPAAAIVCGAVGVAVERFLIRPLRYDPFETLLATWGLGLLLRKLIEFAFGRGYRSVDIPIPGSVSVFGESYPAYRLVLMAIAVAVLAALFAWYAHASTGARIRAMVGNPVLAEAVGIRTWQLARNTFVAGTALAGIAGVMIAPLVPVVELLFVSVPVIVWLPAVFNVALNVRLPLFKVLSAGKIAFGSVLLKWSIPL